MCLAEPPKISINEIDLSKRQVFEMMEFLFLCIDFEYSPMHILLENLQGLFEIMTEYLIARKMSSKDKKERAECTRLLRLIHIWSLKWKRLNREGLVIQYWDFILRNSGCPLLPGFGVATNFGDNLAVNAEKKSLRSIINT